MYRQNSPTPLPSSHCPQENTDKRFDAEPQMDISSYCNCRDARARTRTRTRIHTHTHTTHTHTYTHTHNHTFPAHLSIVIYLVVSLAIHVGKFRFVYTVLLNASGIVYRTFIAGKLAPPPYLVSDRCTVHYTLNALTRNERAN